MKKKGVSAWLKREWGGIVLLAAAAVIFALLYAKYKPVEEGLPASGDYVEYEKARVVDILTDSTAQDETADNAWRGEQMLTAEVLTGQYKGKTLLCYNYVGPLYGVPLAKGDGVSLLISTYKSGDIRATVYEYNRIPALMIVVALFFLVTLLVGGRTGLRSLAGLIITILVLFLILIPMLLAGAPTLPAVFLMAAYIAVVSFTILSGLHKKSLCAMAGTVLGVAVAMGFAVLGQSLARITGMRVSDVEPLLQLRQTGTPIGLRGLLTGGIIVSSLGAVMDVAMSISSALEEVHRVNPALDAKALFRSGMNIGRDMVGTMTNTLILAFLGSGFVLIIYLYSLGLAKYQLFTSAYAAIEIISGLSCSVGMILSIPLTALICALLYARKK